MGKVDRCTQVETHHPEWDLSFLHEEESTRELSSKSGEVAAFVVTPKPPLVKAIIKFELAVIEVVIASKLAPIKAIIMSDPV